MIFITQDVFCSTARRVLVIAYLLGVLLPLATPAFAEDDQPIWKLPPETIKDLVDSGARRHGSQTR